MRGIGRRLRVWFGPGGLVVVIVLLGFAATILAGRSPTMQVTEPSKQLALSLPGNIWAVMFITPLLVGFAAYLLEWTIHSPATLWTRLGASLAIVLITAALLSGMVFQADWNGSSTVHVGTSGGGGNYTGPGTGGSPGGGQGSGNGTNSTGGSGNGSSGSGSGGKGSGGGGSGTGNSTGGNGTGGNSTGGNGTGGNGTKGNGTGGGSGGGGSERNNTTSGALGAGSFGGPAVKLPNWVFLLIAVALSAGVALVVVPRASLGGPKRHPALLASVAAPVPGLPRSAPAPARGVAGLAESPRETIVRLYGSLLGRAGLNREELAACTAQEIERDRLAALRVAKAPAEALTRFFEEACYSAHVIGPPEVDRFVETVRAVEHDLYVGGNLR